MDKHQQLTQLYNDIVGKNVCPELAAGATQLVFGDGSPDTDTVFVGEAPGKKEDEQGVPFVGAAGRFLDEMLDSIELKRKDVYITNIVKYRPPDNRDPLPSEIKTFLPYLLKQLEIIKPKLIVTLGRFSMNVFLPKLKISQVHGQPKQMQMVQDTEDAADKSSSIFIEATDEQATAPWTILPLYHPAAALYNGGMRQTLLEDFKQIPTMLSKIEN